MLGFHRVSTSIESGVLSSGGFTAFFPCDTVSNNCVDADGLLPAPSWQILSSWIPQLAMSQEGHALYFGKLASSAASFSWLLNKLMILNQALLRALNPSHRKASFFNC